MTGNLYPFINSSLTSPTNPWKPFFYSVSRVVLFKIPCIGDSHTVSLSLIILLNIMLSHSSILLQMAGFLFFLSNSFLYMSTPLSLSVHLLMDTSGCFHVLVIVNYAVMNMDMQISLLRSCFHFLQLHIKKRVAGHMVVLFTNFE